MAVKYWYVAGNGNSNFNSSGVWYNGSGGTGGTTTTPTAADDAIVDAASGSGTLTLTATATVNSLNLKTFTGTLAGTNALNITTTTLPSDNYVLQLGGTHNYSGTITFNTTLPLATYPLYINCDGIFHKGNMTFNSSTVDGGWYSVDEVDLGPLMMTGILILTKGYIDCSELYCATISTSNSNSRGIFITDIYLSGSGTLLTTTTQTNLNWNVFNSIHLTNTSATSKAITLTGVVYTPSLYVEGSGASTTTVTVSVTASDYPNVIISKTGGTFLFGTSYIRNLTFIEGSTITWAGTSTVTVYGDVTLCNSIFISTSNPLTFSGPILGISAQFLTTFGKTFTGALTVNDVGNNFLQFYVSGNYISNSSISIVSAGEVTFNNSVSTVGTINISALAVGGFPTVYFIGGISSAPSLSITEAYVNLGSTTLSGALTLTSGILQLLTNSVHSILTFTSSSSVNSRAIYLGFNTVINLRGSAANTWNTSQGLAQGVLFLDPQTSTINITDDTSSQVLSFQSGGCNFYNIHINRSNNSSTIPITTFTGNLSCTNFRDFTVMPSATNSSIVFGGGTTITVFDTFQVGNDINPTYISSSSTTNVFLQKGNRGLVICPRVVVYNMNASPSNTWYGINGSVNNGGNNGAWIFNTIPRSLGSLGTG
jgi:hypothetical protein